MYARATRFTSLVVFLIVSLWIAQVTILRSKDITTYNNFSKKSKEFATTQNLATTHQKRQGVRKDIWLTQVDKTRNHTRIDSLTSTLTLLPKENKLDIMENLHDLKCWMQDKLYIAEKTPMQQMRFFEAGEGSYQYTTGEFLAEAVTLSLFRIPGHQLPPHIDTKAAFLHGIAKDVSFSVAGKSTQFQAESFKATLNPEVVR
jgi:hypothetical protein